MRNVINFPHDNYLECARLNPNTSKQPDISCFVKFPFIIMLRDH